MVKAVKLADIAEKVGVSVVTVSKALSGQKGVSEEMRARVAALAKEICFVLLENVSGVCHACCQEKLLLYAGGDLEL